MGTPCILDKLIAEDRQIGKPVCLARIQWYIRLAFHKPDWSDARAVSSSERSFGALAPSSCWRHLARGPATCAIGNRSVHRSLAIQPRLGLWAGRLLRLDFRACDARSWFDRGTGIPPRRQPRKSGCILSLRQWSGCAFRRFILAGSWFFRDVGVIPWSDATPASVADCRGRAVR